MISATQYKTPRSLSDFIIPFLPIGLVVSAVGAMGFLAYQDVVNSEDEAAARWSAAKSMEDCRQIHLDTIKNGDFPLRLAAEALEECASVVSRR